MRGRIVLLALVALLVAMPLAADWAGGLQREVPLDGNGNTWLVHATVNGSMNGLFLLDTGASYCVLAPTAARRLGVKASGENVEIRTANGVVRAPVIELATNPEALQREVAAARELYEGSARKLSAKRKKAAQEFSRSVTAAAKFRNSTSAIPRR